MPKSDQTELSKIKPATNEFESSNPHKQIKNKTAINQYELYQTVQQLIVVQVVNTYMIDDKANSVSNYVIYVCHRLCEIICHCIPTSFDQYVVEIRTVQDNWQERRCRSRSALGSQLAITLMATISTIIFFFSFFFILRFDLFS